jgi:hypothetical protein
MPSVQDINATDRSKAVVDLIVVIVVFGTMSLSIPWLNPLLRRGQGIGFFFASAIYQFMIEGAAPLTLMLVRHEPFSDYRLIRRGLWRSFALGLALAVVYDAGLSVASGNLLWVPLGRQPAIRMALAAGLPFAPFGVLLAALNWGFLEGFFGIYFSQNINVIVGHSGRGWLCPGVLAFALFNGGVHLIVGQGLEGFLASFASGYAIAVVPALTGNAWGGTLVQTLTNAVGRLH